MELLLFQLAGPMQRWGERSRWDFRDTALRPTKSGIVGFIGCASGYPRGDERLHSLQEDLRMGIRVDRAGSLMVDYQTVSTDQKALRCASGGYRVKATGAKMGDTIITPRQYLQDAHFTIALEGSPALLAEIQKKLEDPVWQIYLGAKNCVPSKPLLPRIVQAYGSLKEALEKDLFHAPGKSEAPLRYDCLEIEDPSGTIFRQDKRQPLPMRQYGSRAVRLCYPDRTAVSPEAQKGGTTDVSE